MIRDTRLESNSIVGWSEYLQHKIAVQPSANRAIDVHHKGNSVARIGVLNLTMRVRQSSTYTVREETT